MNTELTYKYSISNINKSDLDFLFKNNVSGILRTFIDGVYSYESASTFEKKMSLIFKCVKDIEDQLSAGNTAPIPKNNSKIWVVRVTEKQHKFIKKVYLTKEFSLFLNEIKAFVNSKNPNDRAYIICNLLDRYTSKPSIYYAISELRLINKGVELVEGGPRE